MRFFDRLEELVASRLGLRVEVFLQYKALLELRDVFLRTMAEFSPMLGLSRAPNAPLQLPPTTEEVDLIVSGTKKFDFKEYTPDYCYWFIYKSPKRQREEFFGYGAMTMAFLKPDPGTTPPALPFSPTFRKKHELFQKFDVDKIFAGSFALRDGFLDKSKQLFGVGLEQEAQLRGIPFILPLLRAEDFFSQPDGEVSKWFELFDIIVKESPADQGLLLASTINFEEDLIALLKDLKDEGAIYSER